MIGIYKITSPSSRVYIGQSIDIENRWREYKNIRCIGQPRLYSSLKKYGVDKHIFEVVTECEVENLNSLERYYQDLYDVLSRKGLNCVLQGSIDIPKVFSEEILRKKSLSMTGKMVGKNNPFYGKKHTNDSLNKISLKVKEWYKNNQNPKIGRKMSIDSRLKMSEAKIGVYDGYKNPNYGKIGIESSSWGYKHTEHHKKYMREIMKVNKLNLNGIVFDSYTGVYYYTLEEAGNSFNVSKYALFTGIKKGINKYKRFIKL